MGVNESSVAEHSASPPTTGSSDRLRRRHGRGRRTRVNSSRGSDTSGAEARAARSKGPSACVRGVCA
eukprot:7005189-Prymnesium_polylepis.1